ncbi:amylo-alpha-1,6-glucosidase [Cellulosilyticum ruminicola]|uniref:amylo-alpha-1,6-glucosidase n=1 Tax=Cellulosilyticum ruminicola TaxID=425254 RepID=UPI0006CFA661|nr:amylo-alpha-1,6-glucosidase [Cellulosilyticum ruminicola]
MAYHQGTTWAFYTAYYKVNEYSKEAVAFIESLISDQEIDLENQCLGTIAAIFDGQAPHFVRGCYAQAWSVGEVLRVYFEDILGEVENLQQTDKELFE